MSIFEPPGYALLSDEQKARAAALAVGFRYAKESEDIVPLAVFILDGMDEYIATVIAHRGYITLPEQEMEVREGGMIHSFIQGDGGFTLFNGQREE